MLNGSELDDNKKISEYNIEDYTTIHLIMKPSRIQIFIIDDNKNKTLLVVDREDTIKNVKKLYFEKTEKPVVNLINRGKILDDEKKVNDYEIYDNSDLFATNKLKGGN